MLRFHQTMKMVGQEPSISVQKCSQWELELVCFVSLSFPVRWHSWISHIFHGAAWPPLLLRQCHAPWKSHRHGSLWEKQFTWPAQPLEQDEVTNSAATASRRHCPKISQLNLQASRHTLRPCWEIGLNTKQFCFYWKAKFPLKNILMENFKQPRRKFFQCPLHCSLPT